MPTSLDPHQLLHHDTLRYPYTREGVHGRTSEWDIQELHYQRSRSPIYRRDPDRAEDVGPVSRNIRDLYPILLQCCLSVWYVLRSFNHNSQKLMGKRVGERRFVWSSQTNFQMFIYLLMHAFGSIIFFVWLLFAEIDGSKFGSQSSCNHFVIVVLLYANIRATVTWFRVVMIVCFAGGIPFLLSLLGFLILAPARWTEVCTNALQKVFYRYPRLRLARYVIGIP